jgi:hypothetical protein
MLLVFTELIGPISGCVTLAITAKLLSLNTRSGFEKGRQKAPGSSV